MKKSLKIASMSILAVAALSGCSSKNGIYSYAPNEKGGDLAVKVSGMDGMMMMRSTVMNRAVFRAVQVTSEKTLENGGQYFSIVEPLSVSNGAGSMINTPKEFIDKCGSIGGLNLVEIMSPPCPGVLEGDRIARLKSKVYKEKPTDAIVWDANKTLEYLKTQEFYKALEIEKVDR